MRKISIVIFLALIAQVSYGQQKMIVNNSGNIMYGRVLTGVDSIKLDATYARIKPADSANTINVQKALIDSITFTTAAYTPNKIYIIYNGTDNATIINPFGNQGVVITAVGGIVTVTATSAFDNLEYNVLGSSTNGTLAMTTNRDVNLVFNNLTLTNPTGAPINLSTTKIANIFLTAGTTTTLSDGATSTKNGTITSNGPIVIGGTGTMNITGVVKHGINTALGITLNSGTTNITSAASDAYHSEGFFMSGGATTMTSLGDGIDAGNGVVTISGGTVNITSTAADVKGIKGGTGRITLSNAAITINISGAQSKAISAKANITINSGTITINQSGATVLAAQGSGFNPSYATAIKTDSLLTVAGGTFNITSTAAADGGRGFSAGKQILVTGGNITVSTAGNGGNYTNSSGVADDFSVAAFTSDSVINITGGTLNLSNTGRNGKNISADSIANIAGTAQVTIINSGKAGRAIRSNRHITFNGGVTSINISGDTTLRTVGSGVDPDFSNGLRADTSITINSGTLAITCATTASGAKGLASKKHITINGGSIDIIVNGNGRTYTKSTGGIDSYSPAAVSGDSSLTITAGTVTTLSTGAAGKGLKTDGKMAIGSATGTPTLNITTQGNRFLVSGTDYAHPKTMVATKEILIANGVNTLNSTDDGIHSDVSITISGGTNNITALSATASVGEGIEAPIINISGGTNNINASNDGINCTKGLIAGGDNSPDGSLCTISGGTTIAWGADGIDCNGDFLMTNGVLILGGPQNGPEEAVDYNGTFRMNGGILVAGGSNSPMTLGFTASSTQRSMFLKSTQALPNGSVLHIRNTATGAELVTLKPRNATYFYHVSTPTILGGTSYQVYFGGTYTGGTFVGNTANTWGLYQGGTYSTTGATLKSTFTTSTTATINNQNF